MTNADSTNVSDWYAREDRGVSPTLDATLDLLSNRRRRYALYYLREQGGAVTFEELAEKIASWESDADGADADQIHADLYHSQLPRMESAGIVAFDADECVVELADQQNSPIAEYLDLAAREENVV